jgi:hypothetical protein
MFVVMDVGVVGVWINIAMGVYVSSTVFSLFCFNDVNVHINFSKD